MRENVNHTLIRNFTITENDVDFRRKYNLCSLMRHYHKVVDEHALAMGVDSTTVMRDYGAKWILTKVRVEIERFPSWHDEIEVETWIYPPGVVRLDREAAFRDKNGQFARMSSEWCLIDKDTNFPRRPSKAGYPVDMEHRKERGVESYSKIVNKFEGENKSFSHTVRVSDLDMNEHMNNVAYIRLACDTFSAKEVINSSIKAFEIVFKNQCYEGEILDVYRKSDESGIERVSAYKPNLSLIHI